MVTESTTRAQLTAQLKAAEEQIEQLERRSGDGRRLLMELTNEAVLLLNGLTVIDCNPRAEELFSRPGRKIIDRPLTDLLDDPLLLVAWLESAESADGGTFEIKLKQPDGSSVAAEASLAGPASRNDRTAAMLIRDISECKHREARLLETENYLKSIMNSIQTGILLIDERTDVIVDVNRCAAQMIGRPQIKLVGQLARRYLVLPAGTESGPGMVKPQAGPEIPVYASGARLIHQGRELIILSLNDIRSLRDSDQPLLRAAEDGQAEGGPLDGIKTRAEMFRAIFNDSPIGVSVVDYQTDEIVMVNRRIKEMFGYDSSQLTSHEEWLRLAYPDPEYRALVKKTYLKRQRQTRRTGRLAPPRVWRVTCRDGSVKDIEFRSTPLGERDLFILTDVTDRRRIENTLWEYHAALEGADELIAVMDRDYRYRLANETFLRYWRIDDRRKVVGQLAVDVLGPDLFNQIKPNIDRCFQGQVQEYETEVTYPKLGRRKMSVRRYPVYSDDRQEVIRVAVAIRDITHRTQAVQDKLQIFNLSVNLVALGGFDGYFKEINPAWTNTLGWSEEELLSRPWTDFLHPDDMAAVNVCRKELSAGKGIVRLESRYRTKKGDYRWLSWKARPDLDRNVIYCVAQDVTDLKEAENRLVEGERLKAAISTAGAVCHQLNQPLQVMAAKTELMQLKPDPANLAADLRELLKEIERMAKITHRLQNITDYKTIEYIDDIRILDLDKSSSED